MSTLVYPVSYPQMYTLGPPRYNDPRDTGYGNAAAIALILAIVIVAVIILFFVFMTNSDNRVTPNVNTAAIPPEPDLDSLLGASATGRQDNPAFDGTALTNSVVCTSSVSEWIFSTANGNRCQCLQPFFGPSCTRELYDDNYFGVGSANIDSLDFETLMTVQADRLSFPYINVSEIIVPSEPEIICTQECDIREDCIGVFWPSTPSGELFDKRTCTLMENVVNLKPTGSIAYNNNFDNNLFLKPGGRLRIQNRVFAYIGALPLRYYLRDVYVNDDGSDQMIALYEQTQYKFSFKPEFVVNDTGCSDTSGCPYGEAWYGVFSQSQLPITDDAAMRQIILNGTTSEYVVVPPGSTTIDLPDSWTVATGIFGAFLPTPPAT